MSFLNILMLSGLVAAAIPLLIHLFHRQRVSTLDFSSIRFIKSLPVQQTTALKLRQILLMVLRALILILAALAFARPVIEGALGALFGTGRQGNTSFAIVLDNSYSMSAGGGEDIPFQMAIKSALAIVNDMGASDEGIIALTAVPMRTIPDRLTANRQELIDALKALTISERSGDVTAALEASDAILQASDRANRTIYLISDQQRYDWRAADTSLGLSRPILSHVEVVTTPTPQVANISLDAVRVSEYLADKDTPRQVTASYTNYSEQPVSGRLMSLYINGEKRGSQAIAAGPRQKATATFSVAMTEPGLFDGYVELDFDDISVDNKRFFTIRNPERIAVTSLTESSYFVEQALNPSGVEQTPVKVTRASATVLDKDGPDSPDVYVVESSSLLTPARLDHLKRFVASGGGLLLFLGDGTDPRSLNEALITPIFDATILERFGAPGQRQSYLKWNLVDYEHPVFSVFAHSIDGLTDGPRFFGGYRIRDNASGRVLARYDTGEPAVIEGLVGKGRALLFASGLNARWSDLALKGLFVPLLHRSVRYTHPANVIDAPQARTGQSLAVMVRGEAPDAPLTLETPSGESVNVVPRLTDQGPMVTVGNPEVAGFYHLISKTQTIESIAINVDTNESDLQALSPEEISRITGTNTRRASLSGQSSSSDSQGFEIWKTVIWLVVVLLLVEVWYARVPVSTEG